MDIDIRPSALRHGVSQDRIRYVIEHCQMPLYPPPESEDELDLVVMAKTALTKSGRRLSEADVDRLAARAEAGFDLSKWQPRRGRPPLGGTSAGHAPRIAVRVPETLHRRVTARANAEGRSVSEVVRDLLVRYTR